MVKGEIIIGPAGIGPVATTEQVFKMYKSNGILAAEIPFTYQIFIKNEHDAESVCKNAKEFGIELSIHAPYWVNLNADDKVKRAATKKRILDCCEIGERLGAKVVVFHPGYYGDDRERAYETIRTEVIDMLETIKKKGWKIKIAAETMGKINVFGSIEEISRLAKETGCSFCLDFAHVKARYQGKVDFEEISRLFPQKEWHCHFSGIEYGDKGEKKHRQTTSEEWKWLLQNLPKDRKIKIISEAPSPIEDTIEALKIYEKVK